jgi:hypothetical protein
VALGSAAEGSALNGLAASIALEIARRGGRVELVGSIGDDPAGDEIVVELGRAGIGHAALLRDPGGTTPVSGRLTSQLPRLDAADVDLGLRYVIDFTVLIVADPLSPDAESAAIEAAAYHDAALIAVLPEGGEISAALSAAATVLGAPTAEGDGEDVDDEAPSPGSNAFAAFVGSLATLIDAGSSVAEAFAEAARLTGWEQATSA